MQQRGSSTTMETEKGENSSSTPPSRGRHNLKLKVLVRSHAMREETSPPREPSPCRHHHTQHQQHPQQQQIHSPCIQLIPSPSSSPPPPPAPAVVLMSLSPQCLSPTATLVPSPNSRCSPNFCSSADVSPVDRLPLDHYQEGDGPEFVASSPKSSNKIRHADPSSKQASHSFKKKFVCDCQNQNCPKCVKNHERNINNNNNNTLTNVNNNVTGCPNMLTVSRASSRGKLRQQSSSQGSFESSSMSPCLSRDSSSEQYTDTTGVDLELFIPETLNRNPKDRALMLRIEQELVNLAKDRCKSHYKFPPMSSYQRMLVHRCAAYFGMDHNIEPTGKSVVVNKTKCTRIPEIEFKDHIKDDIIFSEEPRRSILKRDSNSIEDYCFKSPDRSFSLESRRSKSFEEREEEYEKARRRIFNREMQGGSSEDFGWSEMPWSSTESDCSARFRLHPPDIHRRQTGKLIKGHSEEPGEATRPCVAKSHSFGGYGGNVSVLSRGDSVMSTHSAGPRLLTKQGRQFLDSGTSSVSWRLSPSSSGYKSQSQMSESGTPSPTSTPAPPVVTNNGNNENRDRRADDNNGDNHIVWAVTNMQNVPRGSQIINPQTGRLLRNDDGTIYHYDPANVPPSISQIFGRSSPSPRRHHQQRSPNEEYYPRSTASEENGPQSPKKPSTDDSSQNSKSLQNTSSTSNSIPNWSTPVTSPVSHTRGPIFMTPENAAGFSQQQQQQQFSGYSSSYTAPAAADSTTAYQQQPYILYPPPPYGVHVQQQFDPRMETPGMMELMGTQYPSEGAVASSPGQAIAYQQAPQSYWSPSAYYAANAASNSPPQRYVTGYVSRGFPNNFMQLPPAQQHHTPSEFVPVYQDQPVQFVYQPQPTPQSSAVYPLPPQVMYPQYQTSTAYPPPPPQMPPYPQDTTTPNSCTSSASGQVYAGPSVQPDSQTYTHLAQSMQHLNLTGNVQGQQFSNPRGPHHAQSDYHQRGSNNMRSNPYNRNFAVGSSQSSTATNSPTSTVIAFCPANPQLMYRPSETPPSQFTYPPPVNFRPTAAIITVRAATPGTSRHSLSPTPVGDVGHYDRPRMQMQPPPSVYQGMPYRSDPRLIPGPNQPNIYQQFLQQPTHMGGPSFDNRSRRCRKPNMTRQPGLPPTGR